MYSIFQIQKKTQKNCGIKKIINFAEKELYEIEFESKFPLFLAISP